MAKETEPQWSEDVDETLERANSALYELTHIKAYTLTPEETQALKAAQYALRAISDEHPTEPALKGLQKMQGRTIE